MSRRRDPVEERADDTRDLYDIATWERRGALDTVAAGIYHALVASTRLVVVAVALLILVGIGGLSAITDPQIGTLTLLSALPALALALYVRRTDVTTAEPLSLLVATFLLGVLTANFAAVLNSFSQQFFTGLGLVGNVLFFFLIVGPIEETVKLLAVRLYAYGTDSFEAVVDGAVYGAVAGLGFATIENALYITQSIDMPTAGALGLIGAGGGITAVRALAGPGHVIYSAFAGYYLGLAKFNPENRGPIIIKGLLIATFIHAVYNTTVGIGTGLIGFATGLPQLPSYLVFVLVYDGFFGLILFGKIRRYSRAYRSVHDSEDIEESSLEVEADEFDP
ncbi:Membrane proteinase PrsW, cleaves anti-sigma factor RsiW, M82 family [Haloplanus vescus]|uniref:Membrane proteinase PrsW, cleaves anti-sigma factor RsiW, M82 family n=1 Tax=Haloplanus vescus TaxID=555874 RepID=A0A1H4AGN2_9EURY|nr:PrsW family intramembrane metalloprotease [Haloplanus vescus]SEA35115.1 Membrane proteinase PrsW, cleaves anti-sigma factor RsiW, M82 family [Haloplanus vescus]